MPCTHFIFEQEAATFRTVATDSDMSELLGEVRRLTDRDWLISTMNIYKIRWFRPSLLIGHVYQLSVDIVEPEYQIINFPSEQAKDSSINHWVSAQLIQTYLYGILAGVKTGIQSLPEVKE